MTDSPFPALSVLVVDDDEDGGDSLAMLLRLYGHRVAVARTGKAALALAVLDPPDVALLDIQLPDLDGWEIARRLRAQAPPGGGKRPFLVAVTGRANAADHARSAAVGLDLHLHKPVEPAFLAGVLERFRRVLAAPDGDTHLKDGTTTGGVS